VSEYKLDLNNFNENQPTPWTDEQYRNAFQSLVIEYHKMKTQRDTCFEDIDKLRERNKELVRENDKLRAEKFGLKLDLIESIKLSEGFLKRYEQLTNHIRMKAEHNPGVSRYIDLVNYIDKLERD